jgi:hypothetical protein
MARATPTATSGGTDTSPGATPALAFQPATINEQGAAIYCGPSVSYLRKARRLGYGPAYVRIGRSIFYRIADLDAWLNGKRVMR